MTCSKNILLVEDDKNDQFFFKMAIKNIGNVVLQDIAEDGIAAIAKLESLPVLPDLIFMDINMPRMNGLECLAEIAKSEHLKKIPVIMLSTSTLEVEETRALGARAFIRKPCNGDLLKEKLELMINQDFSKDNPTANQTFESCLL
ncbi:MAG TPA: response regulator [Chitinophagales bacterium]|nr:response regulator [Chitinophagales bacterium]